MASNNSSDTESVISFQLDNNSDSEVDIEDGHFSDSSSTNEVQDLLQELDTPADIPQPNPEYTDNSGSDHDNDYDLCVDLDNLANDTRSPDEMYDILNKDPEWTQNFSQIHVNQFTGNLGTNFHPEFDTSVATPLDYFQLYFSDHVFEQICSNTNKFHKFRVEQKKITNPSYVENFWEDTYVPEMKAYFGLAVMFGILNQPRYRNFWSKDNFLGNQGVQKTFSLKRYSKLSEYLHVSDRELEKNRGHPEYDKLGKVRWLYDHLLQRFKEIKNPEKCQVIDEQLMPFSGRISYIQYHVSCP